MQLVSRKTLEDLLKKTTNEADESSFSYDEFVQRYHEVLDFCKKNFKNNVENHTYEKLRNGWLRNHCPPIKYIAEGSARAAYACEGGKCLKVAINFKGIAQNKQEAQTLSGAEKYSCFTQIYDFDKSLGSSLMTECCSKAKDKDFIEAFELDDKKGQPVEQVFNCLEKCIENHLDIQDTILSLEHRIQDAKDFLENPYKPEGMDSGSFERRQERIKESLMSDESSLDIMIHVSESSGPQWKVLRDLISFYKKNGVQTLSVGDLQEISNWGLAIREGKIVPVILDAGLSDEVYAQHYTHSEHSWNASKPKTIVRSKDFIS